MLMFSNLLVLFLFITALFYWFAGDRSEKIKKIIFTDPTKSQNIIKYKFSDHAVVDLQCTYVNNKCTYFLE